MTMLLPPRVRPVEALAEASQKSVIPAAGHTEPPIRGTFRAGCASAASGVASTATVPERNARRPSLDHLVGSVIQWPGNN
jgi:hypothetical protein